MGPFCSPLTGSQSERRIRFNLLAHGFSHMTNAIQGFIWKEIAWPPGLLERKNNNKVVSFSTLFLMFTLTWITEKELERVIENKRDEFCRKKNMKIQSGCETMRNASGQQGENERQ